MRSRVVSVLIPALLAANCTVHRKSVRDPSLTRGEWHAIEIDGRAAIPADVARRPSLQFVPDSNRVTGSTGCNRFTGPYTVSGSLLTFGTMAMTRMACLDSALDHQETAFAAALGTSTRYAIVADTLRLFSGSAMRLQFVR